MVTTTVHDDNLIKSILCYVFLNIKYLKHSPDAILMSEIKRWNYD